MLERPRETAGRKTITKLQSSPFPPPLRQMAHGTEEIVQLTCACAFGDPKARRRFQEEDSEAIDNFPGQFSRTPREEAGDFYVYGFENDRIFTRIGTFAGRDPIQFRSARASNPLQWNTGYGHGPGAEKFHLLGPHRPWGY